MKIWKMLGCLALLVVIICGCVAMGKRESSEVKGDGDQLNEPAVQDPTLPDASSDTNTDGESQSGSATVPKTYSEGLRFRSNGDGTCALAGMGTCTAACVLIPPQSPAGDRVTSILPYAFVDSIVGAVEIPTTVTELSAASFAGCKRLSYVRVAAGNPAFAEIDGVLYNADGSTLIYCPAERGGSMLTLPATLRRVAAGAFAECTTLQNITFSGSAAAWHAVIVGDDNAPLYAAGIKFTE